MKKALFFVLLPLWGFTQSLHTNFSEEEKQIILKGDTSKLMQVYQVENPDEAKVLYSNSTDIDPFDPLLPVLAKRMFYSVKDPENEGVGIAGPQVGINRNVVWVQRFDKPGNPFEFFINPKILWRSQLQQTGPEGDLSISDFRSAITRSYIIQLAYYSLDGGFYTEMVEGFTAVIFQHEIDHLSGILITEKASDQKSWKLDRPERKGINLSFKQPAN